ncbi:MAG TPA: hypothetical protein VLZ55_09510 [Rhodanobacter sp.]|nr:hypothetical protein [Rhodanobacter sp.]
MSESKSSSGGIGFAGLLAVLFIGLKLTGAITWSWWWVLSPLWIGWAIVLLVVAVVLLWAALS